MAHQDMIVFAEDWQGLPSSSQHLIKRLAAKRNIIWVNSIGLRSASLTVVDLKRIWHKLNQFARQCLANVTASDAAKAGPQQNEHSVNTALHHEDITPPSLHVLTVLALPLPKWPWLRQLNGRLIACQVNKLSRSRHIQAPILWLSLPSAVDVIGKCHEQKVVYYCGDDFSALAGVDHHQVPAREAQLLPQTDLTVTASDFLTAKLRAISPTTAIKTLLHGVDVNLFTQPRSWPCDLPQDGHPIAGFYGSIENWLDFNLLTAAAKRLPQWHFVFIGQLKADPGDLPSLENVHFLGPKPHRELAQYSQHWTVSLLPFINNRQIQACNPLKLCEYFAAGSPIISTQFNAALAYKSVGLLQLVNGLDSFIEALSCAQQLKHWSPLKPAMQQQVAQQSWDHQAASLDTWLEAL